MKAANSDQREALARLNFTRDGKVLVDFLEEALADVGKRLAVDDDSHRVRAYQGEARTLRAMIDLLKPVSP